MNKRHAILRSYIALARGEHFTPSEIGETLDIGEDSYALTQRNWTTDEKLQTEICKAWSLTDAQYFERMIIKKPTPTQNLVYSSQLRRAYGNLAFIDGFDKTGNFILPNRSGFLAPVIENGLITSLHFYGMEVLRKKAA